MENLALPLGWQLISAWAETFIKSQIHTSLPFDLKIVCSSFALLPSTILSCRRSGLCVGSLGGNGCVSLGAG